MEPETPSRWHRYPALYTAVVWYGALALAAFFLVAVLAAAYVAALSFLASVFGVAVVAWLFAIFVLNIAAVYGYYRDEGALEQSGADYAPAFEFWALAHLAAGPIAAPVYLYRRHRRVGNSYVGTLLDGLPVFGTRI
jgi:hypothetical protein